MKWKVKYENNPDVFDPVLKQLTNTVVIKGVAVYDDGFPADGSGWGDLESQAISNQQIMWQLSDPDNNSYSCEWYGLG